MHFLPLVVYVLLFCRTSVVTFSLSPPPQTFPPGFVVFSLCVCLSSSRSSLLFPLDSSFSLPHRVTFAPSVPFSLYLLCKFSPNIFYLVLCNLSSFLQNTRLCGLCHFRVILGKDRTLGEGGWAAQRSLLHLSLAVALSLSLSPLL